ncbi:MAG TPA: tRNA guanosine(34) transglycosylase Tgt, partial [Candidatus Saccharimonadales bacterium]|nr:tRNA guanosine(34) transglycosylase Tgt [Candidatus Saccharimonadales bacterium]
MPAAINFKITAKDGKARTGVLSTPHGDIKTPAFIPVGTKANVKTLDVGDLEDLKAPAVLANTYHLYLRPGENLIHESGGLGKFMGYTGPTFTDSGGFQVFSLGFGLEHGVSKVSNIFPDEEVASRAQQTPKKKLFKIDDDGVNFVSHLDGSKHRFTPEKSIEIQQKIGADIIFAFDECTSPLHDKQYTTEAMLRTHEWAKRSVQAWTNRENQALFGIIQGGAYKDLRQQSTEFICSLDTPGIAIGG